MPEAGRRDGEENWWDALAGHDRYERAHSEERHRFINETLQPALSTLDRRLVRVEGRVSKLETFRTFISGGLALLGLQVAGGLLLLLFNVVHISGK